MKAASTLDYRELARRRLPHFLFEYIDGGAFAETTLRRNVSDLEAVTLRQRVLKDKIRIDGSVTPEAPAVTPAAPTTPTT